MTGAREAEGARSPDGALKPRSPDTAMILAAGFGTRMGALTATCPKPLLSVAGRTLLDRALDRALEGGATRAIVNLHYLGDMIRTHLAKRPENGGVPEILLSEEPSILETGGGVVKALPLIGSRPFFAVNSDAIWTGLPPLPALAAAWQPGKMGALLHVVRRQDALAHAGRGDFLMDATGRLCRRGEAASAPYVYTGAQILDPAALEGAPEGAFSLNVIWDSLIEAGRLYGVVHEGAWVDVGTPEGMAVAEDALGPSGG